MSDRVGPWRFDRSEKYESRRVKGGPMFTSDLPSAEGVARRKKRAEVELIPDPAVPPELKELNMLEQLSLARAKAGKT
jgi:hypothetical protein